MCVEISDSSWCWVCLNKEWKLFSVAYQLNCISSFGMETTSLAQEGWQEQDASSERLIGVANI